MSEHGTIMCAVDLSWPSEGRFQLRRGAREVAARAVGPAVCCFASIPFSWRARERVAQLAKLRRLASAADVDMTVTVQHGKPADVILQHATSSTTSPTSSRSRSPQRVAPAGAAAASVRQGLDDTLAMPPPFSKP